MRLGLYVACNAVAVLIGLVILACRKMPRGTELRPGTFERLKNGQK